ncbi:MAG TPA: DNA methyltransferase [Phycisphaerae bacterium]|nr:DNA methyltransferase [Phycisphaerae bacterium]
MAKPDTQPNQTSLFSPALPAGILAGRHRRVLFLPAYLQEEAKKRAHLYAHDIERAHAILKKWADLENNGVLNRKETSLDADFLREIFSEALGYAPVTEGAETYQLERAFAVPGVGTADGALGDFTRASKRPAVAVIELKAADVDLDTDRFNGRTAVQQCWDYLNGLPECPWGIVSNFVSIRLYRQGFGSRAFEYFTLQELRKIERLREFYFVFGRGGLIATALEPTPRAERLLQLTGERQRQVGDELYETYSKNRQELILHLHTKHGKSLDGAIAIAQKLLDRIIFVAFCEDRGLLRGRTIERTYREVPPLARVTNPRWQNFLNLFRAIDKGHKDLELNEGYDGGLFAHAPEVDDLQLDDEWTDFFQTVGRYDFRDEVNVDVLGHLFEKSITELEKLRVGGLFGNGNGETAPVPTMPKSAQRKRFGIYYTPPDFTSFLVRHTVGELVRERFAKLARQHGLDTQQPARDRPPEELSPYWNDCLAVLRELKICDPACGSGAFLIQAYDFLEEQYADIIDNLRLNGDAAARRLGDRISDIILGDNLFGVDVSPEAVEITQLALWIRSARRGRTLADLSHNIVCGNSLVDDPSVHPRAIKWEETFPTVFARKERGFDCVIGNPPWERLNLKNREFFAFSAPQILEARNAAESRKLIEQLKTDNPALYEAYTQAKEMAERAIEYVRGSGRYRLTNKGDINTYMVFAETAHRIVSPRGRVGLLVPSGIASDKTTQDFFNELIDSESLICLYDFENRKRIFADLDSRFKFSTLVFGGVQVKNPSADFVFFAHTMRDLEEKDRHIPLSAADMALLNPNTRTCPIFRTRRDAELTRAIYERMPILIDESRKEGGNPWGISYMLMFHQSFDAKLFSDPKELHAEGYSLEGNVWVKRKHRYLPLYEAKMIQAYDHRAASAIFDFSNWTRQGQTVETTLVKHQNPEFVVQPRWWIDEKEVTRVMTGRETTKLMAFKNVTSPTNQRTMIIAFVPCAGVIHSAPLMMTANEISARRTACLLANLNSFVYDYVCRQKIGGINLSYYIINQVPTLPPDTYGERCPWNERQTLERWISERVLKLTCTANDMLPLAEAAGFMKGIHKWRRDDRARLRAELDAAYFLLYGIRREDVEYILSTFTGTQRRDAADAGTFRTAELILEAYDALRG